LVKRDQHEKNRISWNLATRRHNSHKGDQAAFLRNGGNDLHREDMELLGDVRGKSLVHLQCNSGQDTLSIASHLGAHVTGVDISDEAIEFARRLSAESGIPATFIRSDIYDWFATNTTQYDVAYASYGALVWLSDIREWGRGVASSLKPGGRLVLIEFHPFGLIFDEDMRHVYEYMGGDMFENVDGVGDYVADSGDQILAHGKLPEITESFRNPHPSYEFMWGIGEIVTAIIDAGMQLTALREYPYTNGWKPFRDMRELPGRRNTVPEGVPDLPLMYAITARLPE
jgi:SAM-dependent methyltransferase